MESKMRRLKQLLDEVSAKEILWSGTNGVLSLVDADMEPYGVPLSYAYDGDNRIYIHSAVKGHKLECIADNEHCSFCVVGQDLVRPEEFTTYFRSVIVKGKIHIVDNREEMMKGLLLLCEKYSPGIDSSTEISRCFGRVAVLRIDIESMTGKEAVVFH